MSELANMEVGRAANIGKVFIEREVRIKFNTKVTSMRGGSNVDTLKRERCIWKFRSLIRSAKKKVFSFRGINSETVKSKSRADRIKSRGKN